MTISSTTSRWEAVGNGSTTVFPYTNKIFADSDLKVYLDGALKALTTHYTVSGAGTAGGGNVTFVTAPASGVRVVIVRSVANTQLIDYPAGGSFPSVATEDGLDRRTIISQQISESAARSIQYLESDSNLPSGTLPALASLKGRYLKFNISSGAPEAGVFDSGTSVYTTQYLSGNGATTGFILSPVPTSSAAMNVYITGVHQDPTAYTLTGSTLTFSAAPPPGTDNILVQAAEEVPIGTTTSDFVTHQPLGTGAVTRTVQAALRTYMPTLEDFGGGTMVADNAAAFQAAMNAGGRLYVPFGNVYNIKNAVTRTGGCYISGGGILRWAADSTSSGLTVTLTTGENSAFHAMIDGVQFQHARAGVGTALTIDGSAFDRREPPRVHVGNCVFRGSGLPSATGWEHNIVLSSVVNAFLSNNTFVGHVTGTSPQPTYAGDGVRADDLDSGAHLIISGMNGFFLNNHVWVDGYEGVYISEFNFVGGTVGVKTINTAGSTFPAVSIKNGHMNILNDCIDVRNASDVFVEGLLLWQGQNTATAGAAIRLVDCAKVSVLNNSIRGGRALQDYYGILASGTTKEVRVSHNLAVDCIFLLWAQVGTNNIYAYDNHTKRENSNAFYSTWGSLYADTTSGIVVFDAKRHSGKSSSTVAAASGTLVDVDMGTVHLGQTFLVTGKVSYTKGGTDGITTTAILKGAGTASVQFVHDDVELRHRSIQSASELSVHTVSGCMVVTGAGTLTLRCQFTSLGSNATIVAGEAQLAAIQLGTSGRLS